MSEHISPTVAEINLANLRHNAELIKKHVAPAKTLFVLKANAYGHGMIRCAQELEKLGIGYFGVAVPSEGIQLREAGITTPILVFGGLSEFQIDAYLDHDLTFTIPSVEKLQAVEVASSAKGTKARVHLKIDTGMGRLGTHWERLDAFVQAANQTEHVVYEGIYSHLADSVDNPEFTQKHYDRFIGACRQFEQSGISFGLRHIANTGAALRYPTMHLDMVRVGLMLYGIPTLPGELILPGLFTVMSWKTKIVFFKVVQPGEPVGYGSTWAPLDQPERIVTLPVGYADGYGRRFGNITSVLIGGNKYPVVGRVCMDQCMVSLGPDGEAYNGDEVVLVGRQGGQEIRIETLAQQLDTISYEIVARIGERVPRVYIEEQD